MIKILVALSLKTCTAKSNLLIKIQLSMLNTTPFRTRVPTIQPWIQLWTLFKLLKQQETPIERFNESDLITNDMVLLVLTLRKLHFQMLEMLQILVMGSKP
jgi:hypothetical protein